VHAGFTPDAGAYREIHQRSVTRLEQVVNAAYKWPILAATLLYIFPDKKIALWMCHADTVKKCARFPVRLKNGTNG